MGYRVPPPPWATDEEVVAWLRVGQRQRAVFVWGLVAALLSVLAMLLMA